MFHVAPSVKTIPTEKSMYFFIRKFRKGKFKVYECTCTKDFIFISWLLL